MIILDDEIGREYEDYSKKLDIKGKQGVIPFVEDAVYQQDHQQVVEEKSDRLSCGKKLKLRQAQTDQQRRNVLLQQIN